MTLVEPYNNKVIHGIFDGEKTLETTYYEYDFGGTYLLAGIVMLQTEANDCTNVNCATEGYCWSVVNNAGSGPHDFTIESTATITLEFHAVAECQNLIYSSSSVLAGSIVGLQSTISIIDLNSSTQVQSSGGNWDSGNFAPGQFTFPVLNNQINHVFSESLNDGSNPAREFTYRIEIQNSVQTLYSYDFQIRKTSDCTAAVFAQDSYSGVFAIEHVAGDINNILTTDFDTYIYDDQVTTCRNFRTYSLSTDYSGSVVPDVFSQLMVDNQQLISQISPTRIVKIEEGITVTIEIRYDFGQGSVPLTTAEGTIAISQCEFVDVVNSLTYQAGQLMGESWPSSFLIENSNPDDYYTIQIGSQIQGFAQPAFSKNINCALGTVTNSVETYDVTTGQSIIVPGFLRQDQLSSQYVSAMPLNPADNVYISNAALQHNSYVFRVVYEEEIQDLWGTHTYQESVAAYWNYIDNCQADYSDFNFDLPSIITMTTSVLRASVETQAVADPTVEVDGVSQDEICGSIEARIEKDNAEDNIEFITLNYVHLAGNGLISVNPTLNSHVNVDGYNLRLVFELTSYGITESVAFQVIIMPCEITSSSLSGLFPQQHYGIFTQALTISDFNLRIFEPSCDYVSNYHFSLETNPDFTVIDSSAQAIRIPDSNIAQIEVYTRDLALADQYEVIVTQMILGYYYREVGNDPTAGIFVDSFDLEIIDPCETTILWSNIPSQGPVQLYSIIGQVQKQEYFIQYVDTVSLAEDQGYGGFYTCGAREQNLFEVDFIGMDPGLGRPVGFDEDKNFMWLDEVNDFGFPEIRVTYGTDEESFWGSHLVNLKSNLQIYPWVTNTESFFEINFYQLDTTEFHINDYDFTYKEDSQVPLQIQIPQIQLFPDNFAPSYDVVAEFRDSLFNQDYQGISVDLGWYNDYYLTIDPWTSYYVDVGEVEIRFVYHMLDELLGDVFYSESFKVYITEEVQVLEAFSIPVASSEPEEAEEEEAYPDADNPSFTVQSGASWDFSLVNYDYSSVDLGGASFVDFSEGNKHLQIPRAATTNQNAGDYNILAYKEYTTVDSVYQHLILNIALTIEAADSGSAEDSAASVFDPQVGARFAALIDEQVAAGQNSQSQSGSQSETQQEPDVEYFNQDDSSLEKGSLKIHFTNDMQVFDVLKNLESSQEFLLIDSSIFGQDRRILQESEVFRIPNDVLTVRAVPGDKSVNEEESLELDWSMRQYEASHMEIQLNFTQSDIVSMNGGADLLQVQFNSSFLFIDINGMSIEQGKLFEREIPPQTSDLGAIASNVESLSTSANIVITVFNLLQGTSLQYLWEMINSQQLVILFPLYAVTIPETTKLIFNALMTIAAFELVPTDTIYHKAFQSDPDTGRPINSHFADLGFDHHLLMQNFGTLGFFTALLIPIYMINAIIGLFGRYACCNRVYERLSKTLYWGIIMRTIIESYIIALICCFVNFRNLDFELDQKWTFVNSVLTVTLGPILLVFPFAAVWFMYQKWHSLRELHQSYGELYEAYNIERRSMLVFWLSDFLRKQLLVVAATIYTDQLWLQLLIVYNQAILMLIIAGHIRARKSTFARNMDMFNEVRLIVITYHMMLFTLFVPDIDTRNKIGYSCSAVVVIGLLVNMTQLVTGPIFAIRKRLKIRFANQERIRSMKNKDRFGAKNFSKRRERVQKRDLERYRMLKKDFSKMKKKHIEALQRKYERNQMQEEELATTQAAGPNQIGSRSNGKRIFPKTLPKFVENDDLQEPREERLNTRKVFISDKLSSGQADNQQLVKKITWDDLEYFWHKHGIGIAEIGSLPGYENFEIEDEISHDMLQIVNEEPLQEDEDVDEILDQIQFDHFEAREERKLPAFDQPKFLEERQMPDLGNLFANQMIQTGGQFRRRASSIDPFNNYDELERSIFEDGASHLRISQDNFISNQSIVNEHQFYSYTGLISDRNTNDNESQAASAIKPRRRRMLPAFVESDESPDILKGKFSSNLQRGPPRNTQ